jgi:hypothetical protein
MGEAPASHPFLLLCEGPIDHEHSPLPLPIQRHVPLPLAHCMQIHVPWLPPVQDRPDNELHDLPKQCLANVNFWFYRSIFQQ